MGRSPSETPGSGRGAVYMTEQHRIELNIAAISVGAELYKYSGTGVPGSAERRQRQKRRCRVDPVTKTLYWGPVDSANWSLTPKSGSGNNLIASSMLIRFTDVTVSSAYRRRQGCRGC